MKGVWGGLTFFFFQAEDGIRDLTVTGVQTCALPISFEATPVLAFGLLYLETGTNIVIALDPESGRARWRFDPRTDRARRYAEVSSRGVSVWESGEARRPGPCRRLVFTCTLDARLLALDAETGRP